MVSGQRLFTPRVQYTSNGWFAQVYVDGSMQPYWRASRLTKLGAKYLARRMARKYNRLEKRGLVA